MQSLTDLVLSGFPPELVHEGIFITRMSDEGGHPVRSYFGLCFQVVQKSGLDFIELPA